MSEILGEVPGGTWGGAEEVQEVDRTYDKEPLQGSHLSQSGSGGVTKQSREAVSCTGTKPQRAHSSNVPEPPASIGNLLFLFSGTSPSSLENLLTPLPSSKPPPELNTATRTQYLHNHYCLTDPGTRPCIHQTVLIHLSEFPSSPTPTALLLPKLWDLDLSNVEATPHVEPRTASLLPPTTLKDVHPPAQSLGTYPPGHIPSQELTTSRLIPIYDLFESYIDVLASATPTTQYHKVPYFYLTSLCLRDLSGPPRNPLKGHPYSPRLLLGHSCPQLRFL
ncbi:hypothetical protein F5877DRAFT_72228 [Lentinula edodes]|nr:hypothetical protein F5877DRAFT_72228 [Lentinula edodes]